MQTTVMREMISKKVSLEAVLKTASIGAEVTTGGRLFQRRLPATGNARSQTVDSRVRRITSCKENDDWRWDMFN